MAAESAGLLMYRRNAGALEVLLAHPGGPFWMNRDIGVWTIPKGEVAPGEEAFAAAVREFQEEMGLKAEGPFTELTPVRQKSGKLVRAWAFEGDCDPGACVSNTFEAEWPPKSGRYQSFAEVDRVEFFPLEEAREKVNAAQAALIDELARLVRQEG